jgi:hypothetical protein
MAFDRHIPKPTNPIKTCGQCGALFRIRLDSRFCDEKCRRDFLSGEPCLLPESRSVSRRL